MSLETDWSPPASASDMIGNMKFTGDVPWELRLSGFEVGRISFGTPLDIYLYNEGGRALIRLSGPFEFHEPERSGRSLDPETRSWGELAVLLGIRDDQILRATAWKDARLRVEFSSGRVLSVYSEGPYESWEVEGADYKIVGTPGEVCDLGRGLANDQRRLPRAGRATRRAPPTRPLSAEPCSVRVEVALRRMVDGYGREHSGDRLGAGLEHAALLRAVAST